MLETTEKRLNVIMIFFLAYLISPIAYGAWLYSGLVKGAFQPDADAIMIPFAGCVLLWLLAFPFFLFACGLFEIVGRKIHGSKS